jgi:hypothetical protein
MNDLVELLAEALSNRPISDSFTFMAGIAQYRLRKVVSAWRMNATTKWRYSSYVEVLI